MIFDSGIIFATPPPPFEVPDHDTVHLYMYVVRASVCLLTKVTLGELFSKQSQVV